MRWWFLGVLMASLAGFVVGAGCQDAACSPCRPGTYPSDPSQSCSACLPCAGGGTDAHGTSCR